MFNGVNFDYGGAQVLVTGGSNGIGLSIATAYRDSGANVTITGRRESASDYSHDLSGMTYCQLEVTDHDQIIHALGNIEELDILVNNAGGHQHMHDNEWNPAAFDAALTVNLSSIFHVTNAVLDRLKASEFSGGASVIGISSSSAFFGFEPAPGYAAAKAALVNLIKTYAVAWEEFGIRANGVAPGFIPTNLTKEYVDSFTASYPDARQGRVEEVSAAVLFLTSPAASWITGHTLRVDGGFTIRTQRNPN